MAEEKTEQIIYNTMCQLPKGSTLYMAGEDVNGLFVLVKGRAVLTSANLCLNAGSGDFLGLFDLPGQKRTMSCIVTEDVSFFALQVQSLPDLISLIKANKEYGGRAVVSLFRLFRELSKKEGEARKEADRLTGMVKEVLRQYLALCLSEELRNGELPERNPLPFEKKEVPELFDFYTELSGIPAELQGKFYSSSVMASCRLMTELLPICGELLANGMESMENIRRNANLLINSGSDNLFFCIYSLLERAQKPETKKSAALLCDLIEKRLSELTALFELNAGKPFAGFAERRAARKQKEEQVVVEEPCEDSLTRILTYAGATEQLSEEFTEEMKQFKELIDITSSDDDVRKLKKQMSEHFYEVYEMVFRKAGKKTDSELPVPVRLMLNFGFLDETLISRTRLLELERLTIEPVGDGVKIFSIREWLSMIYDKKREPSKNEFDLEYVEMLRERLKNGEITEEEMEELAADRDERLHYEIMNLFRQNNRLVNGQLSIFVPFLCEDLLMGGADKCFLRKSKVQEAVEKLKKLDISLFYREFLYHDPGLPIEKEMVVREIMPDVILFPTSGGKSIMWQDVSCRRRDSGGRFLLPMFAEVPVEDLIVRVCGRYRWELCRTLQGVSWNNIQYKSLTAEYSDYLMYYRKNHDITEEKKERVKLQLQKGKNNYREVFAMDYEAWVRFEVNGAMKLNKVAREIMATYCPFDRQTREKLVQQPAFEEAMARGTRQRLKRVHDLEIKAHILKKNDIDLPEELAVTIQFYKEK